MKATPVGISSAVRYNPPVPMRIQNLICGPLKWLWALPLIFCMTMDDVTGAGDAYAPAPAPKIPPGAQVITLGAGCFWCTEAVYQQIPGVLSVTSGYMGGRVRNPTYKQVLTGATGHAEVVQVVYDPGVTSLEKILATFWNVHDPTTLNRQGPDVGTQYRSAIFYHADEQRSIAEKSKAAASNEFSRPIVTEITKAAEFYPAEKYHQDYYRLNKFRNPYCQAVIAPKLRKAGLKE